MSCCQIFTDSDQERFAAIKIELAQRMPANRPDSEEVHRCALLFVEVRDRDYQRMDGHDKCEPWMDQLYDVGDRQAAKYFITATLPAEEVQGKHQGVEVTGQ